MSTPVLTTRLFAPPPRPRALLRARLIARLNEGLDGRLTLISAPAGFGKTSLAASWLRQLAQGGGPAGRGPSAAPADPRAPRMTAWLSLDASDSDPARFLGSLVAALQTLAPGLGSDVVALLGSAQPPPIEALLPPLLNQIAALPGPAILALDDCHLLAAGPAAQALAVLVEHGPPWLHLALITREDPPLPLARLRARGQLSELRTADLRFTRPEAAAFLGQVMGLRLADHHIDALESRTEGWVAGLQLAALSLQGHPDAAGFVGAFAGDDRSILEYLVDEVLSRQPAALRSFLLQTAILDRLHGPLCDAVTGQSGGAARLEALHRGNFFVVPLDDRRQWYRYHQLFAEVLAAQLAAEQPGQVAELHRRASAWFEGSGEAPEAIRHALAAQEYGRAADLIELAAPALIRQRQERTALGWYRSLPDDLIRRRPALSVGYVGALLACGDLGGVAERLRDAEVRLEPAPAPPGQPQAAPAPAWLPGAIAVYRAAHALALGDAATSAGYARQALGRIAADDRLWRGAATGLLGLASWAGGELDAAYRTFADGLASLRAAGNIADAIGGSIALADIRVAQGRLREARQIYEAGLRLAAEHGDPQMRGTADMYVGLGELARERGDLQAARQLILRGQEQGEHTGFPQHPYRWRLAMAQIVAAQGDLEGALELIGEAERRYVGDFFPPARPLAAWRARALIAQGRLGDALEWARDRGLSAHDQLSYLREFEHITLARLLLARARRDPADRGLPEAASLLGRLCAAAEAGGRTGSLIEILALLALARQLAGDLPAALAALSRALALAEPEGYLRRFVDEGPPMAALLERVRGAAGEVGAYADTLLRAPAEQPGPHPPRPHSAPLIEPLSEREREVLRLLKGDLGGPQIAHQLVVSLNTLRTHTRNIYAKLGVRSRRAAVRRAEDLGLL